MSVEASVEYSTVTVTIADVHCTAIKEENIPTEDPLLVTIQPGI